MSIDVYVYGMTVLSTIHRCRGELPLAGGYAEIEESFVCPGGEGMNAALLLSGLGLRTALGGPHFGTETRDVLTRYASRHGVDVSGMVFDASYPGLCDLVLVGGEERAVLGWFGCFFTTSPQRFAEADTNAIERCRVAAIDPYFGETSERAAYLALQRDKPYVTIDCPFDSALHRSSEATVVSREYRAQHYPGAADDELLEAYAAHGQGLCVFTAGKAAIVYARGRGAVEQLSPPRVAVKSTLGAGDAFRAGIVYALALGMCDRDCVRFAADLAALTCTRLPIADHLPSVSELEAFRRALGSSR